MIERYWRFSAVGLLGAGLQLVVFSRLTRSFGFPSMAATPIAVEVAILHNFLWHQRFNWRGLGIKRNILQRLWRFHAANGLISIAGNSILMYCLVDQLKVPAIPSAFAAIALCSLANFLVADRWVFARVWG